LTKASSFFSKHSTPITLGKQSAVGGKVHFMSSQLFCAALLSLEVSASPRLPPPTIMHMSAIDTTTIKSRSLCTDFMISPSTRLTGLDTRRPVKPRRAFSYNLPDTGIPATQPKVPI
jgi:hypothetical protein